MKSLKKILIQSTLLLIIFLGFNACEPKYDTPEPTNDELVISQFLDRESNYSEFNKLAKSVGLDKLLGIRGPYTLFLPNNDAMMAYYKSKGISSCTDLDSLTRRNLVLNHILAKEYTLSNFRLGTLGQKNGLGDNISVDFPGSGILINKVAKISKKDIKVSNGVMQEIDAVLEPLTLNVFEILANNPDYSIFTQGLIRTGLKDTLQNLTFKYGKGIVRSQFTILAIADTTFNRYGINSIDDLINKYTTNPGNITSVEDSFYLYMDYHCLDRDAYYASNFFDNVKNPLYSTLSKNNNVQIKLVRGKIGLNIVSDKEYTGLYLDQSNVPAKNGVIHTINTLLPVTVPPATSLIWEVTDYFDFKQGEYYLNHFQKFYDTAQFAEIRWEGLYLEYYIKPAGDAEPEMNEDCLNMINWWKIEVTTPKIMKGKYKLSTRVWQGNGDWAGYVDGVQVCMWKAADAPTEDSDYSTERKLYLLGTFEWPTTSKHKIKLVALSSGRLFWDRVEFKPVAK